MLYLQTAIKLFFSTLVLFLISCGYASVDEVDMTMPKATQGLTGELIFDIDTMPLILNESAILKLYYSESKFQHLNISKNAVISQTPAGMLELHQESGRVLLKALKAGFVELKASYQGLAHTQGFTVLSKDTSLIITTTTMNLNEVNQFNLYASYQYQNGQTQLITEGVTWTSLTPALATVDQTGLVQVINRGFVKIQAQIMDMSAIFEIDLQASANNHSLCPYPAPTSEDWNNALSIGSVFPPLAWENVYQAKTGTFAGRLDLNDIYCGGRNGEFERFTTINIILTTGWCSACPPYLTGIASLDPELENHGGLTLYMELEDTYGDLASTEFAKEHLGRLLGLTGGYFIGDLDTKPVAGFFRGSAGITGFPSAIIIRRSDMKIILSRDAYPGELPFIEVAQDPQRDWLNMPSTQAFDCGGQSQSSGLAINVNGPAEFTDSLCGAEVGTFFMNLSGSWKASLTFDSTQSDLDLFLVDINQPNAPPIASSRGNHPSESISSSSKGLLIVQSANPYDQSQYSLKIEAQ